MMGEEFLSDENLRIILICICVPGAVANILCIKAITRKNMKSPTNDLLSYSITNDTFALIMTVITIIIDQTRPACASQSLVTFREIVEKSSGLSFALNSWFMAGVAVFRYFIVSNRSPKKYFTFQSAKITAIICVVLVNLELLSYHLRLDIVEIDNTTCYEKIFHSTYFTSDQNTWRSFFTSLFTLLVMTVFSMLLVTTLGLIKLMRRSRQSITNDSILNNKWILTKQITYSLIGMVLFSSLAEIPFVVTPIIQAVSGSDKSWWAYDVLLDIYYIFTRLNSAASILFLSVSKTFRKTLIDVIRGGPYIDTGSIDNEFTLSRAPIPTQSLQKGQTTSLGQDPEEKDFPEMSSGEVASSESDPIQEKQSHSSDASSYSFEQLSDI